ncbi:protein BIG GRAIN 1-like B [Sesamum indicum]|uniref:Protein BIG GRAIN 1-like B n=1 Tax=Sesamum indicum TaxID=4182 RepID=A0A6I9URU3_SESIN|nr:protein BIG GRAIN 1-like B [Sesamum indicum]
MYCREKPNFREENHKARQSHRNTPSFSSSLLDEIYRSIDGNDATAQEPASRAQSCSKGDEEEMGRFTRACLVDKWMEKEVHEKANNLARRRPDSFQDYDVWFFSSTSTSSDSSGALSSSDTELFCSTRKPKQVSCFSTRPKPVRTTRESNRQDEFFVSDDDDDDDRQNQQKNKKGDDLMKSKSRALKIYANLKKLKQPISPGGRLTSFINSLFTNANSKKSRNPDTSKGFQHLKSTKTTTASSSSSSSACSSAASFSRSSCMSKNSSSPDESRDVVKTRNGNQRTVRFHPVSVIVDQDSKACGHKSIYDEDCDYKHRRPPLPPHALKMAEKNRKVEDAAHRVSKGYRNHKKYDFPMFRKIRDKDEDEDDAVSESSSDLFELDHLTVFGKNRFCEELPVYESTYFFA